MGYKKIRVTNVTLVVDIFNCLVENTRRHFHFYIEGL